LLSPSSGVGQEPAFRVNRRQLNTADGLSQRQVQTMHQDAQGFMWIGTRSGLNFFDGHTFRVFSQATDGMAIDTVQTIAEDTDGRLWLYHTAKDQGFLTVFQPCKQQARNFDRHFGDNAPFSASEVVQMQALPDRSIFLSLASGDVWRYGADKRFARLKLPPDMRLMKPLASGNLLCRQGDRLAVADRTGRIRQWLPSPGNRIEDCCEYGDGSWLALAADGRLLILEGQSDRWQESGFRAGPELDMVPVGKLSVDPVHRTVFIANGIRICILAPLERGEPACMLDSETFERNINEIRFDRQGTAWVSTDDGICLFSITPALFTRFSATPEETDKLNCRGLGLGPDGRLYVALNHVALVACDPESGRCDPTPIPGVRARAIAPGTAGRLWLAENELVEYLPGRGVLNRYAPAPGTGRLEIWSLAPGTDHHWWLGCEQGLAAFDPARSRYLQAFEQYNDWPELKASRVLQILPAETGIYWLATNSGLYRLEDSKGITARYWPGGQGRFYLPSANIQHVYRDTEGIFWLATGGQGLIRWNPISGNFRTFTKAEGLSSDNLYAVYEDGQQQLWISSDYGIICFHKQEHSSRVFLPTEGVSHYEFNRISHYRAPDGRIFFGSLDGITAFYPEKFPQTSSYQTPLKIAQAQRYDSGKQGFVDITAEIGATGIVHLPSDTRLLLLNLSLQDYFHAPQTVYEYALDSRKDWSAIKGNELHLSALPYGTHRLRIRAKGAQGRYSTEEQTLDIQVAYPFYLRGWFVALSASLTLAGFWSVWRRRINRLQEQPAEPEQEERRQEVVAAGIEVPVEVSADERWLLQLQTLAREALAKSADLSVPGLAEGMHMSRRNFQRKIRQMTGLSPNQYITECRLDRARQLLENRAYRTVREVAYAVGFETPHYFSSIFQQRFGRTPGSYLED